LHLVRQELHPLAACPLSPHAFARKRRAGRMDLGVLLFPCATGQPRAATRVFD
jgi:hypothetical protein